MYVIDNTKLMTKSLDIMGFINGWKNNHFCNCMAVLTCFWFKTNALRSYYQIAVVNIFELKPCKFLDLLENLRIYQRIYQSLHLSEYFGINQSQVHQTPQPV